MYEYVHNVKFWFSDKNLFNVLKYFVLKTFVILLKLFYLMCFKNIPFAISLLCYFVGCAKYDG